MRRVKVSQLRGMIPGLQLAAALEAVAGGEFIVVTRRGKAEVTLTPLTPEELDAVAMIATREFPGVGAGDVPEIGETALESAIRKLRQA